MRLILQYYVKADCGGDTFEVTIPILYESAESLKRDFQKQLEEEQAEFTLGGQKFYPYEICKYREAKVSTVDGWFDYAERKANTDQLLRFPPY